MVRTGSLLIALALVGCGGAAKTTRGPVSTSPHGDASPHGARQGPMDIRAAKLPFVIYDRDGRRVDESVMLDALGAARAVCVGEVHRNPHHHWVQLHLFDAVSQRIGKLGGALALGFEMFQAPFQSVLDAYAAGTIDERVLLARSEWRERWGSDFSLYQPTIRVAVDRGHKLLALNQRVEIVSKVGKQGLGALSDDERAALPELVLDDAEHRAWFDKVMEAHPWIGQAAGVANPHEGVANPHEGAANPHEGAANPHEGAANPHEGDGVSHSAAATSDETARTIDDVYAAQVIWDETMADNAATWLAGGADRKLVILAGNGHCHDSAIVRRLTRRGIAPVLSVRSAIDDGQGGADDALRAQNNDYVLVMVYE